MFDELEKKMVGEVEEILLRDINGVQREIEESKKVADEFFVIDDINLIISLQLSLKELEKNDPIAFDNFMKKIEWLREEQLINKGWPENCAKLIKNESIKRENFRKNNKIGEYSD